MTQEMLHFCGEKNITADVEVGMNCCIVALSRAATAAAAAAVAAAAPLAAVPRVDTSQATATAATAREQSD
jgi:hypothetical protein